VNEICKEVDFLTCQSRSSKRRMRIYWQVKQMLSLGVLSLL